MDSLNSGSGKERVCCQGGQSRVETNVDQDEARGHASIAVSCLLFARFRGGVCARSLQQFVVGVGTTFP